MNRNLIINAMPSHRWMDAAPAGNGHLGAMVYGKINEETILLNYESLYHQDNVAPMPDMSKELAELRKLLDNKQYKEADYYYTHALEEKRSRGEYGGVGQTSYMPGVDLVLLDKNYLGFKNYKRILDMETGEISVLWQDGDVGRDRRLFVSRAQNIIVLKIAADKEGALDTAIGFAVRNPQDNNTGGCGEEQLYTMKSRSEGQYLTAFCNIKSMNFGSILKVFTDGKLENTDSGIRAYEATQILVLIDMFGGRDFDFEQGIATAAGKMDSICPESAKLNSTDSICSKYNELFDRHKAIHAEIFNRAELRLCNTENIGESNEVLLANTYSGEMDNALIERMFRFGRYLLISSSDKNGYPANLQGIWNGDYDPAWYCAFFNNENIQMNYWQALQGNMPELMEPFFELYERLMEDFRINAKNLYGCRGILLPLYMSAYNGLASNLQPHCLYWTAGAGWIAAFFFDYYQFTGDKEYLKNRALPFMEEVLDFYRDFIVEDENGKLKFYPGNSPENTSGGVYVCINATMDIAVFNEVVNNLIIAYKELEYPQYKIDELKALKEKVPGYEINCDGAIREWIHPDFPDNYKHRHLSHLYPAFPGTEVTRVETPGLFEACKKAVEKRLVVGLIDQSGWSLAHSANIYARLGEGDAAYLSLQRLVRVCTGTNLLTYHNDWRKMGITIPDEWKGRPPFQIDANFGFTSAIIEMIVFSKIGLICLLPAIPGEWKSGELKGVACRGGIVCDVEWNTDEKYIKLIITSTKNQTIKVYVPSPIKSLSTDDVFENNLMTLYLCAGQNKCIIISLINGL